MFREKRAAFQAESAIVVKGGCPARPDLAGRAGLNRAAFRSERRARLHHVSAARQRIGAEPAVGECARDRC